MFEWRKEKPVFREDGTFWYGKEDFDRQSTPEELIKLENEVLEASNKEVLQEYIYYCGGDDYDGCKTTFGNEIYPILHKEINKRLTGCGFLEEEIN